MSARVLENLAPFSQVRCSSLTAKALRTKAWSNTDAAPWPISSKRAKYFLLATALAAHLWSKAAPR
eukprot:CAMPEP_0184317282 /NCGR_PEP_ID=MMETSP1049-20130417/95701_1 /TAXON_ID=77928 /ORGANISM="Proteomonas sulcata, Strain CCMP704" /LENGTH=65 /DNA_ID=CAMNT_0026636627 /DNA_START=401 /DNA_END=594 /DNA_ORIENTATION=-